MVQMIPFVFILSSPIYVQIAYFVISLWFAIIGRNRSGGFWCYLFASVLLSPFVAFMMLLVAEKKTPDKAS